MTRRDEGRPRGGPPFFRRLPALLVVLAGCAGGIGGGGREPEPPSLLRPLQVYKDLGMIPGNEAFPAVASFASLAGPGDSTYVLFGLSLPNAALRFQREGEGFRGEYAIDLSFQRDSVTVRRIQRQEAVRIGSFTETGRTDESVVFQALVPLPAGSYTVSLTARDAQSARGFEAVDTIDVPAYGSGGGRLSEPLLVYRAGGRAAPAAEPDVIVNPRRTVPYGDEPARVYLESYGGDAQAEVRAVDAEGRVLWSGGVALEGTDALRHGLVEIPAASLPVGRLWLETRLGVAGTAAVRTPMVVAISDRWMVSNFEEALEFLTYIAAPEELDSLRTADGQERRDLWERFWRRRDPVPATPLNEFREEFFQRVRIATLEFAESGVAGWQTDRGEVFIVLGPPDQVIERRVGRETADRAMGQPNALEWVYDGGRGGRIDLLFIDRGGLGRFELTPASRLEFREAADRLRPRPRS